MRLKNGSGMYRECIEKGWGEGRQRTYLVRFKLRSCLFRSLISPL